jgi:hypothetical protein
LPSSEYPDPSIVLSPNTSSTAPLSVLSHDACEHEQLLKFFIGLRLLGEVKAKRLLAYIQVLQQEQKENPQ